MKNMQKTKDWLEMALDDMQDAIADINDDRFPSSVFHSQQCAEKLLKSMFEEMIESYLARLKDCKFDNNIDIKSVILFGSVARGLAKEHSDIDLIIVASGLPELKRRDELPPFRSPARIQDIWMTPEELEDMVIAKTGFVVDALLDGKVLQDDGTATSARARLVQSLERLKIRKLEHGWMIPRSDLNAVINFD